MKIINKYKQLVIDNSATWVKKIIILIICTGLFISIIFDNKVGKTELIVAISCYCVVFFKCLICNTSFIINENGITKINCFVFRRHIEWPQISEYFAEEFSMYRSSAATHHRFVFVYGPKSRTVHTAPYSIKELEKEEKIRSFCDSIFEKTSCSFDDR